MTGGGRVLPTSARDFDFNHSPPRTYETVVSSSSNAEWQQRLTIALRFIQYIGRDVIGNPAAFGKLIF